MRPIQIFKRHWKFPILGELHEKEVSEIFLNIFIAQATPNRLLDLLICRFCTRQTSSRPRWCSPCAASGARHRGSRPSCRAWPSWRCRACRCRGTTCPSSPCGPCEKKVPKFTQFSSKWAIYTSLDYFAIMSMRLKQRTIGCRKYEVSFLYLTETLIIGNPSLTKA